MEIELVIADYCNENHGKDIGLLLGCYAACPTGGGKDLPDNVKNNLASALAEIPYAFSVLCYIDGQCAGLANCFEGFSTFKCKPLINIHDMFVLEQFQSMGVGQKILSKVEEVARQKGCCKITLEVLENNNQAQGAYVKFGFSGYELGPVMGKALFWQKTF